MALFGLVFGIVTLVLIGVGVAIGLAACVLAAVLIGLGVVSSSVVVGLRTGRPGFGIRVFLLQSGLIVGIPAGAICAWLARNFYAAYGGGWPVLIYGAFGGAISGLIVALLLDFISRRLHAWVSSRVVPSR